MTLKWAMGWMLAVLCVSAMPAQAQTSREMRKQIEASMLIAGTVDVERDGSVSAHALDEVGKLPPSVVALVDKAVAQLRFAPVLLDGVPVLARARMSLRIVARPMGEGNTELSISSAHFGEDDKDSTLQLRPLASRELPRYPFEAMRAGGQGTVYLVLQVGRDGKVMDAISEQVNLRSVGSARDMQRIRRQFSEAALGAARKWSFQPPTTGDRVDDPYWTMRVPVDFSLGDGRGEREPLYGTWQGYLPGPRQHAPWVAGDDAQGGADAVAAGAIYPLRSRFRLLTPIEG